MVRRARQLAMTSMLGVMLQYAVHEKCTPKTFSERLFFNPATMPVCASLGHLADATWSYKTWDELAGWLQTLLSAAMYVSQDLSVTGLEPCLSPARGPLKGA